MKKIIGIILLLWGFNLFSQSTSIKFKNSSGIYGEILNAIPTSDGGQLLLAGYDSLCLVKIDNNNQVTWAKTIFDYLGGFNVDLIEKNSNYYMSFQVHNTSFIRLHVLKFNNSGQLVIGKHIEYNNFSMFNPSAKPTISVNNSDEIIINSQINEYLTCLKLDNTGNSLYSNRMFVDTIHYTNMGYSSIIQNNGCSIYTGLGDTACVILKLNSMGGLLWAKSYHFNDSTNYYPNKIIKTTDNNYLISGYSINWTYQSPFLMKIDTTGNLIWYNQYSNGPGGSGDLSTDLTELSNKNILIYYEFSNALVETDSLGNVLTKRVLSGGCKNIHSRLNQLYLNKYDQAVVVNNSLAETNCLTNASLNFNLISTITSNTNVTNTYVKTEPFSVLYTYPFVVSNTHVAIEEVCNMVGIKELDKEPEITIFPNPTTSILNIFCESGQSQSAKIEIKNYMGQVVYRASFTNQINLSDLSAGMYFLIVNDGTNKKTVKIIKY